MKTFVLTTGGTGGHVFAAQSLAEVLKQKGHRVVFFTDQRGQRYWNIDCETHIMTIRRDRFKIFFIFDLLKEFYYSFRFLYRVQPNTVIGFGSYVSFPIVIAAQILRITTIIHEQNAIMGKANRYLSLLAKHITCSFKNTKMVRKKPLVVGNPSRNIFSQIEPYKEHRNTFNLLILGGSQGARLFSTVIPKTLKLLPKEIQEKVHIFQQCREELLEETLENYRNFHGKVELKSFFDNVNQYYEKAHLVISRSGASTVSEICLTGRPSILVPFAASLEGDQWHNALCLKEKNAAIVLNEYFFSPYNLSGILNDLIKHPFKLQKMAESSKNLMPSDAAQKLAEFIEKAA